MNFPCKAGKASKERTWAATRGMVDRLQQTWPDLDIEAELMSCCAWLVARPPEIKTHDGMPRFVDAWLRKAQNNPRLRAGKGARRATEISMGRTATPTGYQKL